MAVFLLDTNVLIALGWPNHVFYRAADRWHKGLASDQWATCPITECGFIRISSNQKSMPTAGSPALSISLLDKVVKLGNHVFWEDDVSLRNTTLRRDAIRGHQQVTDAYLLSLSIKRGGRLATFDQEILSLATTDEERACVFIIPT